MASRDKLHYEARHALENDGWTITDDPLVVRFGETFGEIDLGAERLLGAEKGEERIAVEIKSFLGTSMLSEFHMALGQYLNYQEALACYDPNRRLYLAVSEDAYRAFFLQDIVQRVITRHQVEMIIFSPEREVIVTWKK
jgi:hypothetical protein